MVSIMVTGTNGKTSVCYFLEQLCLQNNITCSRYSTTGCFINGVDQCLPDAFYGKEGVKDLKEILSEYNSQEVLIWETFSSTLASGIYSSWKTDLAVLTNISKDHLQLHGSEEKYKHAKYKLFKENLKQNGTAILPSKNTQELILWLKENEYHTHILNSKDPFFTSVKPYPTHTLYYLNDIVFKIDGPPIFTTDNLKYAIQAFLNAGKAFQKSRYTLKLPKGRLTNIRLKEYPHILIDYAHNEDAFKKLLSYISAHIKDRLILVFGCGGNRDTDKREAFGKLAKKYADEIIVTDDNPRNEIPAAIRQDIIQYCPKAYNISNRKEAIKTAIEIANPTDHVLILGRGHESSQDYGYPKETGTDEYIVNQIINHKS